MSIYHFDASTEADSNVLHIQEACGTYRVASPQEVVQTARTVLARRMQRGMPLDSPNALKDYMKLQIGTLPHEVFVVAFADAQHQLIAIKEMFRGTLTQTSVYPREVVKEALALNASAVFLAHNHPSGACDPSRADELLTKVLKEALALVDVRVVDHLVVSATNAVSFAERGLI